MLVGAALIPIVPFVVIGELPGDAWLQASSGDALPFGATGAVLLASDLLLPIPSSVIGALLGARLGFVAGFGFGLAGLSAGSALGYALGRLLPARFAADVPSAPAMSVAFLSRPVPVLAEAVAIAAGAERMGFGRFMLAASIGNACYAGALAANGAALMPAGLSGPGLVLPMALPVVAWLLWRKLSA